MFEKIKFLEDYENETIKQYFELKKYYKIYSQKKEDKQNKFYKSIYLQNRENNEIFSINRSLENETNKYKNLISLKVKELNRITKENELIPLFVTFTNPSKFHPFVCVNKEQNLYELNKNYAFFDLKECITESYKNINMIYREFYKNIKTFSKDIKFIKIVEPHKSLICHLHRVFYIHKKDIEVIQNKYKNVCKKHKLKQCKFKILRNAKGSSYITKYILKNFSEEDLHSLNGYKKLHKIRMFSMSNLNLKTSDFKKLYFNNKDLNKKVIEEIKTGVSIYDNLYQFYTLNTKITTEKIDENGEIRKETKNSNDVYLFTIYRKMQKEKVETEKTKIVKEFDRKIETFDRKFFINENKKVIEKEETLYKNKYINKYQKKYYYEIIDNYLDLISSEKVYIINKYLLKEKKENETKMIYKTKKVVIKNKKKVLYDNERFKIVKIDFQKEEEKLKEFNKVA